MSKISAILFSSYFRYSDAILCELVARYERPDSKNRWDSPLFELNICHNTDEGTPKNIPLPIEDLHSLLIMVLHIEQI